MARPAWSGQHDCPPPFHTVLIVWAFVSLLLAIALLTQGPAIARACGG